MKKGVLILGSYGNFGKYIARSLLSSNTPIILSGRNPLQLQKLERILVSEYPTGSIGSHIVDIDTVGVSQLQKIAPKVVINTCGPFQSAGFSIVQKCIQAGVNYIDLADGRQFVNAMMGFDQQAKQKGVLVVTGASSVPGLSSAVMEEFKGQFKHIHKVQYGISPGQRTNRGGEATTKGVLSYIGKTIAPYGSLTSPIYGWQNLYGQIYPQLGLRLFGNCEVPDLDLFPKKYGIKELRFSAGTQSKFLHIMIWLTSWLIKLGMPINLPKYSSFLLQASHQLFDGLGTDAGGMHFNIYGTSKQGKQIEKNWYIIVRKGHGPNVPVIPALVLCRKILNDSLDIPAGVHPCVGLVTLSEYLQAMKQFDFSIYTETKQLAE